MSPCEADVVRKFTIFNYLYTVLAPAVYSPGRCSRGLRVYERPALKLLIE